MEPSSPAWLESGSDIEAVPAYEAVAQRLRRAIHLGELRPGSRLPAERLLAEEMGVSRVTLREAIRTLAAEGYLETERGSRSSMHVHSGSMRPQEVRSWMRKRWDELEGLLDFRLTNERCAAERAAERVSPAEIAELRVLVEQGRTSEDVNAFRRSDVRFHMRIAEIAACDLLRRAVEDARAELYVPFRAIALDDMLTVGVSQHARIVDAFERHDPSRAGRAMATHLNTTADQLHRLAGRADQRPAVD